MPLISELDAISILGDQRYDLRETMIVAWNDYLDYAPSQRRIHGPTTRANIVHDHIKQRARERFGDWAVEFNQLFVVVIDQRLVVRFKRFHNDKTSSNIRTRQLERYRMQQELPDLRKQLDLFGELSNLEVGYVLDRAETEIRETWLACPSGLHKNYWTREILDSIAESATPQAIIKPLFQAETTVQPKEATVGASKRTDRQGEAEPS